MRVSAQTLTNSLVDQLNRLASRQVRLQTQAASGQRLTLPEDDPVSMRRVLDLQAEAGKLTQYRRNLERLQELATASFSALKGLKAVSDRAGEIAVRADGLKGPSELNALANELDQLIHQAVALANTRNRGDALFGGTQTGQPAFVASTDAQGRVISVDYAGNADAPEIEIDDSVTLSAHTVGANLSGTGPRGLITDPRAGADFFNHLISLRDHLRAGDLEGLAADRAALAADEENLLFHLGTQGAVQARLETSLGLIQHRRDSIERLVSREADADLTRTIVRLTEVQTAYQAALQSGASLLSQSLLDYLR
jgi:flagellar hook-associated protein 3 FlgL